MDFINYRCLLALLVYCSAILLLIVNGQPTTEDDSDEDVIGRLIVTVEELRAELTEQRIKSAELETALLDRTSSKFSTFTLHSWATLP